MLHSAAVVLAGNKQLRIMRVKWCMDSRECKQLIIIDEWSIGKVV